MHGAINKIRPVRRALLCLNEADIDAALRRPIFGKPLLFHLIKNLKASGINRIAVSVDLIPPELPGLIDRFQADGLDVNLVRHGPGALRFAAEPSAMLLQNAAIWIEKDRLAKLVASETRLILTIPEDPDFANFERIDLARRWAGVAIIDGSLAAQIADFPDGWSVDSFLLRSALQAGYPDRPIVPEKPADDVVVHGRDRQAAVLLRKHMGPKDRQYGLIDTVAVHVVDRAIDRFAAATWWNIVVESAFPAFAILAALLAFFEYDVISYWIATFAIIAWMVRGRMNEVGYRLTGTDAIGVASFVFIMLTLHLNLRWYVSPFDSAFLPFVLCALVATSWQQIPGTLKAQFSPLFTGIWLTGMASAGFSVVAVKVAILAMVIWLFVGALRWQS